MLKRKSIFSAAAVTLIAASLTVWLVSCDTVGKQARQIGEALCGDAGEWRGTFYNSAPRYPNDSREVWWLAVCEEKLVSVSNSQNSTLTEYTPADTGISLANSGGYYRRYWSLVICPDTGEQISRFDSSTYSSVSHENISSASLAHFVDAAFPRGCSQEPHSMPV